MPVVQPVIEIDVKRTDLAKLKGVALEERVKRSGTPGRFGRQSAEVLERREQRERDRAQGLIPLAVKLNGELVKRVQTLAQERGQSVNEIVAELLEKGLRP